MSLDYVPWYSQSDPPSARTSRPRTAGNAHLLNAVLHFKVPIFRENPVDPTSLLDLGTGGTFTVSSGNLRDKLDKHNVFFSAEQKGGSIDGEGDDDVDWGICKEGSTVAIKSLNLDRLDDLNEVEEWPDLESIITEIAVLAHPMIRSYSRVARMIGIGWEGSTFQENEERRYAPYLVTEFGSRGSLTDYFRYRHRMQAMAPPLDALNVDDRLKDLPGPSSVSPDTDIPWSLKIGMSLCVVDALYILHHHGVVHGDVKFENVVTGSTFNGGETETLYWKLCDFGSSILLAGAQETEENRRPYRLKSQTIPWNAPEAETLLSAVDAIKTDIYSFGHLFARIMLNGHDVFDSSFHVAGMVGPKRDMAMVHWMVEQDAIYDHVVSRLEDSKRYTTEQLMINRKILSCTLRTNPSSRVACLSHIRDFIVELDQIQRGNKPPMKINEMSQQFNRDTCELCFSKRGENGGPQLVEVPSGLFQLHGITDSALASNYGIMKEVFHSLRATVSTLAEKSDASSSIAGDVADLAEASAHLALWHLRGCGTPCDFELALKSFISSANLGEFRSILATVFLSRAMGLPLPEGFVSKFLPEIKSVYPTSNNRLVAEVLKFLDPDSYKLALKETCSGLIDLLGRERVSIKLNDKNLAGPPSLMILDNNLEVPGWFGLTELHQACIEGSVDRIKACLGQASANVNCCTSLKHTPLWIACSCGNAEAVKLLLGARADPTIVDSFNGLSPLHFLSRFDAEDIPVVGRLLLQFGGDPNAVSKSNETPLMFTFDFLRNFRAESVGVAVSTLLSLGASPLATMTGVLDPPLPPSPLKSALRTLNHGSFWPMYEVLLSMERSDTVSLPIQTLQELKLEDASDNESTEISELKEERIAHLNKMLFLEAVRAGTLTRLRHNGPELDESLAKILRVLLGPRSRHRIRTSTGESALSVSIECHSFDITEAILRNELFSPEDLSTPEVLGRVLSTRKLDLVLRMIKNGLDLSARNSRAQNFLHLVSIHEWTASMLQEILPHVKSRVDLGELARGVDNSMSTPFDTAVMSCQFPVADLIFECGVNVDSWHYSIDIIAIKDTRTLLGRCLISSDERTKLRQVRYLIGKKPGFQVNREFGSTALIECLRHWKLQRKKYFYPESGEVFPSAILEMLLRHFSGPEQVNGRNYLGMTPLHVAAVSGDLSGTKMLLDSGAEINALDNGRQTPLEAVGDQLYNLTKAGSPIAWVPKGESSVPVVNTSIEYFVMLQVYQFLLSKGAKPGTQIQEEAPGLEVGPEAEAAELVYQSFAQLAQGKRHFLRGRGSEVAVGLLAPPERNDLGSMVAKFVMPTEQPASTPQPESPTS